MANVYERLLADVSLPAMVRIRQTFKRPLVPDVCSKLEQTWQESGVAEKLAPGMQVAIAVGSRGIAHVAEMVESCVRLVKRQGAHPFIVPSMGSHGGATAEGQQAILAGFGITEERVGAPVRSSMETVVVGHTPSGLPVHFDALAAHADATIVLAKIKPHPGFRGRYESGLAKMIVIGLGKQVGAELCHSAGMDRMAERVEEIAREALRVSNVAFAIGVLENAYDEIADLVVIDRTRIMDEEPALLETARAMMPAIPFASIDVLVVDQIGKNISGPGMDCNVIRRYTAEHIKAEPLTQRIVIRDLTNETAGNATGVGNGDVITRRLFDKIQLEKTYPNQLTSRVVVSGKIPLIMDNDELAIKAGLKTTVGRDYRDIRLVRIKNTLQIDTMEISEILVPEITGNPNIAIIGEPFRYAFDNHGNLIE